MDPLQPSYARSCKISSLCEQQIKEKMGGKEKAKRENCSKLWIQMNTLGMAVSDG